MNNVLEVENRKMLSSLKNHIEGEVAYIKDEQIYMIYKDGEWTQVNAEMTNDGLKINLYNLNKQAISQFPILTEENFKDKIELLNKWVDTTKPYMLYGKETGYFTLFQNTVNGEFVDFGTAIVEILKELNSDIYAIDLADDKTHVEIWVKLGEMATLLYLFDFSEGVITYGK